MLLVSAQQPVQQRSWFVLDESPRIEYVAKGIVTNIYIYVDTYTQCNITFRMLTYSCQPEHLHNKNK